MRLFVSGFVSLLIIVSACDSKVSSNAQCGNGTVQVGEECDGESLGGFSCQLFGYSGGSLACDDSCHLDTGGCLGTPSSCGNGRLDLGEECDATELRVTRCSDLEMGSGEVTCSALCRFDLSHCTGYENRCGDGIVGGDEECDGGAQGDLSCQSFGYYGGELGCNSDCTADLSPCLDYGRCGDSILQATEECEALLPLTDTCETLGFHGGELVCGVGCQYDVSGCEGLCGNGTVEAQFGEECDGSDFNGESCESQGYYAGQLTCTHCTLGYDFCGGRCGDGTLDAAFGEECDGAIQNGETCLDYGYDGGELACTDGCTLDISGCGAVCGDGLVEGTEQCDGSNLGGASCQDVHIAGGNVSCNADCTVNYWACTTYTQLGSSSYDKATRIAKDSMGNIFIAGYTTGSLWGYTNQGGSDIFLIKFSSAGVLVWAKMWGSAGNDEVWGLTTDSSGNVYVSGSNGATFMGNPYVGGSGDAFIMKVSSAGVVQWTTPIGTSALEKAAGCGFDSAGNIYISGYTYGSFPGYAVSGSVDIWLARLNSAGAVQWVKQWGSTGTDLSGGLVISDLDEIYIGARYAGSVYGVPSNGGNDIGVTKFDTDGNHIWTAQFGTTQSETPYGMDIDETGAVILVGLCEGALPGTTNHGSTDICTIKVNNAGGFVWAHEFGSSLADGAYGVTHDSYGNYVTVGIIAGAMTGYTYAGNEDIAVASYTSSGTVRNIRTFGTNSLDRAYGTLTDSYGNIYITGVTEGVLPGASSSGYGDIFIIHTYGGN